MYKTLLASTITLALFSGCGDDISSPDASALPAGYTVFDTKAGNIPYPNNLLFAGSDDGTLNIPYDPSAADAIIKESLNTLDGFSTTAPISVSIDGEIDPLSLAKGLSLYKVDATASALTGGIPAVTAIENKLTFGVDYYATLSGGRIVILPLKPLASNANYMITLDRDIVNKAGQSLESDPVSDMLNGTHPLVDPATGEATVYLDPDSAINSATAMKLEGLRKLNQAMLLALHKNGEKCTTDGKSVSCDDITMLWSFKTQTIGKVAKAFANADISGNIVAQATGMTTKDVLLAAGYDVNASMAGIADLYVGQLMNIPYYLSSADNNHSTDPLTKYFVKQDGTDMPKEQSRQNIPLLVSVPNHIAKPAAGWPVVIFQHGITKDRTMLLPVSEAFASIGYATVSIDLPLHGLTKPSALNPTLQGERTFGLDLVDNKTGVPGPDGIIDDSGTHYINLASPLVSRDNLRQSTSDLIALKNALATASGIDFDASKVAFVGHSLGTIASFGFLANNDDLESVSLAMPGGGIAQLLNNSETFGPIIKDGLASKGIISGTPTYASFMIATQTLIDDGDSINYAAAVKAKHPNKIYSIKVIGDRVIPNSVTTSPLSGTNPLLNMLGMSDINISSATDSIVALTGNTMVQYTEGDHGSILSPAASFKATVEMQTQTASYVQSLTTMIKVTYPDIIKQ